MNVISSHARIKSETLSTITNFRRILSINEMQHIIDPVYIHTVDFGNKYIHLFCLVFNIFSCIPYFFNDSGKLGVRVFLMVQKKDTTKMLGLRSFLTSMMLDLKSFFTEILRIPSNIFAGWIITKTVVTKSITQYQA